MKRLFLQVLIIVILIAMATPLFGDAGILIPRNKQQPNAAILSLEEMEITVLIDNGDARVFVRQVFANHTGAIEEGNYIFALPSHATISDFATWDGPVRLPAVILERKRAEEISSSSSRSIPDFSRWVSVARKKPSARRCSVRALSPLQPTERSGWKSNITSPSRLRISGRISRSRCGPTLIKPRQHVI
jgi:hypothetical protein